MTTQSWYKKFKLELDLKEIIDFSRTQMTSHKPLKNYDHQLLDKNSNYWDWPSKSINSPCIKNLLQYLEVNHQLPVNTDKTSIALWEYGEGDELPPHTDLNLSLSGTIVISLIGRFETRLHDEENNDAIIDQTIYGPGEYIILNNTVVRHSGKPLDNYRLALVVFIDPDYNLTNFWRN